MFLHLFWSSRWKQSIPVRRGDSVSRRFICLPREKSTCNQFFCRKHARKRKTSFVQHKIDRIQSFDVLPNQNNTTEDLPQKHFKHTTKYREKGLTTLSVPERASESSIRRYQVVVEPQIIQQFSYTLPLLVRERFDFPAKETRWLR